MADSSGIGARRLAIKALVRIEQDGAYANLLLPTLLDRSDFSERDRSFITELVYGTTRMIRACDFLVDRFVLGKVDAQIRAALRVGAYQLHFLDTPRHAAVSATVGAVKGPGRGVVNAVLRKVADASVEWPNDATRLSYPTWIARQLSSDLGEADAAVSMEAMNEPATATMRDDGYFQDEASQRVVTLVDAQPGERVADLCAAPGGKATGIAATGAFVAAADLQPHRVALVKQNIDRLGTETTVAVVADALHPPFRPGSLDRVLVDAPCSGLGSLRRRPDARWRIDAEAPVRLAALQVDLVEQALPLLCRDGVLTYSVCTLTTEESTGVLDTLVSRGVIEGNDVIGSVGRMLPVASDGMCWFQIRKR